METDIQKLSNTLRSNQTLIVEVLGDCQKRLSLILDPCKGQKKMLEEIMSIIDSRNDMLGFLNAGVLPEDMQDILFDIMACILANIQKTKDLEQLWDMENLRDSIKPFLSEEKKEFEKVKGYNSQISLH